MSLDQLESAVANLPPDELARFRLWFQEFDGNAWDEQIAQDAASGRLDSMAQEALKSHLSGESREL